jgi:hypothetical protein
MLTHTLLLSGRTCSGCVVQLDALARLQLLDDGLELGHLRRVLQLRPGESSFAVQRSSSGTTCSTSSCEGKKQQGTVFAVQEKRAAPPYMRM